MLETIFADTDKKIQQRITHLKEELAKLRLGHATPSLIEDISVSAYGTELTIKEVGAIASPQPNLFVVTCWDDSVVDSVAKAILLSNLGINPVVDGKTIKVPIPAMSEERRQAMVKQLGEIVEATRVDIRQIRQEKMKSLDDLKQEKKISQDEHETAKEKVQKIIDEANEMVEKIKEEKQSALSSA